MGEQYFRSYGTGRPNGPSLFVVANQYREKFQKPAPTNKDLLRVVAKFRRTGSVLTQRKGCTGRPVAVTTNANQGRFFEEVLQSPNRSLQQTSLKINFSEMSTRRMFKKIEGFSYKIQIGQCLNNADKLARVLYYASMLAVVYNDH